MRIKGVDKQSEIEKDDKQCMKHHYWNSALPLLLNDTSYYVEIHNLPEV